MRVPSGVQAGMPFLPMVLVNWVTSLSIRIHPETVPLILFDQNETQAGSVGRPGRIFIMCGSMR